MSSLVLDFQRDLVQSAKTTTELLRTGKLIAAKLGLDDVTEWISSELNGYDDASKIPSYRRISGGVLMLYNPVRGWTPVSQLDTNFPIGQRISEVEELAKAKKVGLPLAPNENYPVQAYTMGIDISNWRQQIEVSPIAMKGLLSAVRDRLLDWSTELEKRGIVGENMSFGEAERKSAQSQTFHIQHFTGVFGNVSNSTVEVYDYSSIHSTLRDKGVPQQARNELENIMDELKTAEGEKKESILGKAKTWIAKNAEFLGASAAIVRKALGIGESN